MFVLQGWPTGDKNTTPKVYQYKINQTKLSYSALMDTGAFICWFVSTTNGAPFDKHYNGGPTLACKAILHVSYRFFHSWTNSSTVFRLSAWEFFLCVCVCVWGGIFFYLRPQDLIVFLFSNAFEKVCLPDILWM